MSERGAERFVLGPRVTVFTLLREYPFLRSFLLEYDAHFAPLGRRGHGDGWARVAGLEQAAMAMETSWREFARDIAAEVERVTGAAPGIADGTLPPADAAERAAAAGRLMTELEGGGSLPELAQRFAALTRDLDPAQSAALDRDLFVAFAPRRSAAVVAGAAGAAADAPRVRHPPGHPLEALRREGLQVRRLSVDLREALQRLGGSPSRTRWRAARPLVARLVGGLSGVESRFRRHSQAWFPALAVVGVDGPATLLEDREALALETLRRLRLATEADDAATVVEAGLQLVARLDDILIVEDEVLAPLAEGRFSDADWAAVRELEDGIGWSLIPSPPLWPG